MVHSQNYAEICVVKKMDLIFIEWKWNWMRIIKRVSTFCSSALRDHSWCSLSIYKLNYLKHEDEGMLNAEFVLGRFILMIRR